MGSPHPEGEVPHHPAGGDPLQEGDRPHREGDAPSSVRPAETEGGVGAGRIQVGRELAHEGGGDLLLPDSLLEQDQGGDGLAVDVLGAEDGEHLPGERLELGRPPLPEIEQRQVLQGRPSRQPVRPGAYLSYSFATGRSRSRSGHGRLLHGAELLSLE